MKIRELLYKAQTNTLDMPEIQRGWVWPEYKMANLIDSLYSDYPISSIVFWHPPRGVDTSSQTTAPNAALITDWVLDGMQRTTALCLMAGFPPRWLVNPPKRHVQFHPLTGKFQVSKGDRKGVDISEDPRGRGRPPIWVDVECILGSESDECVDMVLEKLNLSGEEHRLALRNLSRLYRVRERDLCFETCSVGLDDLPTVFERLNTGGKRPSTAEVTLAIATALSPGWRHDGVNPLLDTLTRVGWNVHSGSVLRSVVANFKGSARLNDMAHHDWRGATDVGTPLNTAWTDARDAWLCIPSYFQRYGVGTVRQLNNATSPLVALVTLRSRYPRAFNDSRAFAWAVDAIVSGRYSSRADAAVNADVHAVVVATSLDDALERLNGLLEVPTVTASDFMDVHTGPSGKARVLLMWLAAFDKQAGDWASGASLQWRSDSAPELHHVFPKDLLFGVDRREDADRLVNMSFLSKRTNIACGNDEPRTYMARLPEGLEHAAAQAITDQELELARFDRFMQVRSTRLANDVDALMQKLRSPK